MLCTVSESLGAQECLYFFQNGNNSTPEVSMKFSFQIYPENLNVLGRQTSEIFEFQKTLRRKKGIKRLKKIINRISTRSSDETGRP